MVADNVIISEVLYNEPGGDTEAEWIQLYNPTSQEINLEGWSFVTNNDIRSKRKVYNIDYGIIPPGETFLFGKSDFQQQYGREPDQVLGFILTNKRMLLSLLDDQERILDEVGWGRGEQWSHLRAGDNQSLLRIEDETWVINTNPELTDVSYLTDSKNRRLEGDTVMLSEVLYNEPGTNTEAEWIQLYNPTDKLIHLEGWELVIYNKKIASKHPLHEGVGFIGPGETYMLGKSDFRDYYGRLADTEFDFVLTNKRLVLGLMDPSKTVVDKVGWNMEEWSHLRCRDNQSLLRMDPDTWIVNTNSYSGNVAYEKWSTEELSMANNVIFSQILYNEPGSNVKKEWIQIYNPTPYAIDISQWKLTKNKESNDQKTIVSPLTFLDAIRPREYLVFGKDSASMDFRKDHGRYPDGTFDFDLTNRRMILTLQDETGNIVDQVRWGTGTDLRARDNQSIQRRNIGSSNEWVAVDNPRPFQRPLDSNKENVDICC